MTSTSRITAVIAVLLLCSSLSHRPASARPDYAAIEKEIDEVFAEITKAAESVNADKLFSFVADNDKGSLISGGKITLTRQEALEDYRNNSRNITKVDYTIDRKYITVISPQTALVVVEGSFEATTSGGNTFGSPFVQTVVFVLKDNRWKVLHSHTSSPAGAQ